MDDSRIKGYLGTKNLVGVKINKDSEAPNGRRPKEKTRFCKMVKAATGGSSFVFDADDLECPNAMIALGFQEPSFLEVPMRISPAETKSVEVAPVSEMENPDVVLAVLNPRQLMMIGERMGFIDARFKGDMAVCGEATAWVYMNKKPNISPLCGGSRRYAKFKESELMFGAPPETFEKFDEVVKSLPAKDVAVSKFKRFLKW